MLNIGACLYLPPPPQQGSPVPGLLGSFAESRCMSVKGSASRISGDGKIPQTSMPGRSCLSPANAQGWDAGSMRPAAGMGVLHQGFQGPDRCQALFRHVHGSPNSASEREMPFSLGFSAVPNSSHLLSTLGMHFILTFTWEVGGVCPH